MNMKINIPVRMKNVWFWVGLVGVVLTAMGVSPEMFTSWGAVADAFISLISNPFMLGSVAMAVLGVFAVLAIAAAWFLHTPAFGRLPQGERLERISELVHEINLSTARA